ncbi:hypothetical protein ACOEKA_004180 [Vibrio parahaemolyticus]
MARSQIINYQLSIINYQKGIIMRKSISKATRNAALSITLSISAIAIAATCFYSVKTISDGKIEEKAAMEQLVAKRKATMNLMDEFVIKQKQQKQQYRFIIK